MSETEFLVVNEMYLFSHGVLFDLKYDKKPKEDWVLSKDELTSIYKESKEALKGGYYTGNKQVPAVFYSFTDNEAYFFLLSLLA